MIGTTDNRLVIDRVASDSETLLGYEPAELLGRPVLSLVDAANVPHLFGAFAGALRSQLGVSAAVAVRSKDGRVLRCDAIVLPLAPAPTTVFALRPAGANAASTAGARFTQLLLEGVTSELSIDLATAHAEAELPGVTQLTTRQLEIVRGFLSGDRIPAIADRLFVSQSTIRSHLALIYLKLGVHSQQQLVDRFRVAYDESRTPFTQNE